VEGGYDIYVYWEALRTAEAGTRPAHENDLPDQCMYLCIV